MDAKKSLNTITQKGVVTIKLTDTDKDVFQIFKATPYADAQALKDIGITQNRINTYVKEGLLQKISYNPDFRGKSDKLKKCFRITKKGQKMAQKQWKMNLFVSTDRRICRHDVEISRQISKLTPEERSTIVSEHGYKNLVLQTASLERDRGNEERYQELLDSIQSKSFSAPDFTYQTVSETGEISFVSVEVTTSHYGEIELQAKQETATILGSYIEAKI